MLRRLLWFIAERLHQFAIRYCKAEWCKCCGWTIDGCGWGPREHDYLCYSCDKVVLGRGYGRSPNNMNEWWCQPCAEKIIKATAAKPLVTHAADKELHDRLMAEMQATLELPSGVYRSATFANCSHNLEEKGHNTQKINKPLTLKVQE